MFYIFFTAQSIFVPKIRSLALPLYHLHYCEISTDTMRFSILASSWHVSCKSSKIFFFSRFTENKNIFFSLQDLKLLKRYSFYNLTRPPRMKKSTPYKSLLVNFAHNILNFLKIKFVKPTMQLTVQLFHLYVLALTTLHISIMWFVTIWLIIVVKLMLPFRTTYASNKIWPNTPSYIYMNLISSWKIY